MASSPLSENADGRSTGIRVLSDGVSCSQWIAYEAMASINEDSKHFELIIILAERV